MAPSAPAVVVERLRRQGLSAPLRLRRHYVELFRRLQPVATKTVARPGSPPRLVQRTLFDDAREANRLRRQRRLVKGRFIAGGIGYVLCDDLELYANVYRKPLRRASENQARVLEAVRGAGPLTPRQLKQETALLNKQIMPALHRLQQAFLVYEDQLDDDWERSWYEFASEWPEVEIREERRVECATEVVRRFLDASVFATAEQIRDGTRLAPRLLTAILGSLEREGRVIAHDVAGLGSGFLPAADEKLPEAAPERRVMLIHKADFLARSHASELARRFGDRDTLHWILVDGAFAGAVCGHWGFHPYDVEDVVVELPRAERQRRRGEILARVTEEYPLPRHRILRYAGAGLPGPAARSGES